VHVLEHLDTAIAVGCLEHGDVGGVTVQTDGGVSPLAADPGARPSTVRPRSVSLSPAE
jgi:hypothetical protein